MLSCTQMQLNEAHTLAVVTLTDFLSAVFCFGRSLAGCQLSQADLQLEGRLLGVVLLLAARAFGAGMA